ncbi:spore germination protein [Bacillus toyonensis]|uniref:Spore germination protein n=1 Tax=Bacillus toyonensis TaxID=155322 RepID=A0A2B5X8V5_9BACI|nr:spore germination protein [Bacillus toyonensis]PGA92726.1 spore germination protein [Bacillus toyonensis]PHD60614.1 spore germination protein [Bacillus toyonensis]
MNNKKTKNRIIQPKSFPYQPPYATIEENTTYIKRSLNHTNDLKIIELPSQKETGVLLYLETVADADTIQKEIMNPLMEHTQDPIGTVLSTVKFQKTNDLNQVIPMLLKGISIIYIDKNTTFYLLNTVKTISRTPDEPINEKTIRGSHEGFIESIDTNLNLIRKRIENPQLTIKYSELGNETHTKIAIAYMNDLADPMSVQEIERRLQSISTDMIFSPGYLEDFIEDYPWSPFPHILYTERPDRVMAHLMEGRIALLAEGSADVIIVPITLFAFFQTPDDFNSRIWPGSLFRLLRFISFVIALILPATYVAVISYHFEMIPSEIIVLVKGSVEGIPFPPFIEAIIMAFMIELIREAGIRLPTPIGQTIGIVGGLIIGDAVVRAGLVSNIMLIVIALTAIASFTIPSYEMSSATRIISLPLMVAATCLGFAGITFGIMFLLAHLCKLESLGKPYFAPLAPLNFTGLKDSFLRFPIWKLNKRPKDIHPQKEYQQYSTRGWDDNNES